MAVNASNINYSLCTLQTCPLSLADVQYIPSLAGNTLYLTIFVILLIVQCFLGVSYRTWGFLGSLFAGLTLEVIGYVGRVQMHYNDWLYNPFLMYLICLTIGPVFFAAAIYLSLARIVPIYGLHLARFAPRTYTIIFIVSDFVALLLQAAGGAIAATSDSPNSQTGIDIMIAGLSFQVVSLTIFVGLCGDFAWRVRKARAGQAAKESDILRCSATRFQAFLCVATLCIYVRSCFRVAELKGGFRGRLANQQVTFMILEGAMIVIACIALTVAHPGFIFKRNGTIKTWKNNRTG
ncbi:MAG: hypothetical protein M1828_005606 [Chrysothrix sp. TS-e1954]|nr:MAG: hypothetical protein M1828_005606 [Chrysothrix sp. TS-e1954]